jgi:hypothetical protein
LKIRRVRSYHAKTSSYFDKKRFFIIVDDKNLNLLK